MMNRGSSRTCWRRRCWEIKPRSSSVITVERSQTALTAAAARAAHLIVDDEPRIFADVLASAMLGDQAEEFLSYHRAHGTHLVLRSARAQATCRSRYTEDRLADSVRGGVTQYVILGAGLDSFAYRCDLASQVRVFEVDHPATQPQQQTRTAPQQQQHAQPQ